MFLYNASPRIIVVACIILCMLPAGSLVRISVLFCMPDAARLFNGNGTAPFSAGLAPREEFFAAVQRREVLGALQTQLKALCQQRAPEARWQWIAPPTDASQLTPVQLPAYEQWDLLTDPAEEKQREDDLLGGDQNPSQTTGSASRQ